MIFQTPDPNNFMGAHFATRQGVLQAGSLDGYIVIVRGLIAAALSMGRAERKDTFVKMAYGTATNLRPDDWDDPTDLATQNIATS